MTTKPQMKDQAYAARHRDIISSIAASVVNSLRPESFIAKIWDYNVATKKARVLTAGSDANSLITVSFGEDLIPSKSILSDPTFNGTIKTTYQGDIVRISGRPGRYFILSFISGTPAHSTYDAAVVPVGGVVQFPLANAPTFSVDNNATHWLPANGALVNIVDYPALYAVYGVTYGGDGVVTFGLPTYEADYPTKTITTAVSAQIGWTVTFSQITTVGMIAHINITASRSGTDILTGAAGGAGDIANSNIFLVDPLYSPRVPVALGAGLTGRMYAGYLAANGLGGISATTAGTAITIGDVVTLNGLYVLPANPSAIKMIRCL